MHDWLLRLTRPEDPILWVFVAIAAAYAGLGVLRGLAERRGPTR